VKKKVQFELSATDLETTEKEPINNLDVPEEADPS
jgi:hypothetical protein